MAPKRRAAKGSARAQKSDVNVSTDATREDLKAKQEKLAGFISDFDLAVEEHLSMMDTMLNSYVLNLDKFRLNLVMKAPCSLWKKNYLKESKRGEAAAGAGEIDVMQEKTVSDNGVAKTAESVSSTNAAAKASRFDTAVKTKRVKKAAKGTRTTLQPIKKTKVLDRLTKARMTPIASRGAGFDEMTPRVLRTPGPQMSKNGGDLFLSMHRQPTVNLPLADGHVLTCQMGAPLDDLMVNMTSDTLKAMTEMRDYLSLFCEKASASNMV